MEPIYPGRYVIVNSSGQVELRAMKIGLLCTFAFNAQLALLNGNIIQVNLKDGSIVFYKIEGNGNIVSGPYMSV